uniref:Uncharacterized protein n=1 Tax=Oryza meridionalis TaxID=40149 RepID=A0A0E0E2X2_9ORYZ
MEESADRVGERQQAWQGKKRGLPRRTELARVTANASIARSEVDNEKEGPEKGTAIYRLVHAIAPAAASSTSPLDLKHQQGKELPNPLVVEPQPPSSPHTSHRILLTLAIASSKPSVDGVDLHQATGHRRGLQSRLYQAGAHLHLAALIGHKLPSQTGSQTALTDQYPGSISRSVTHPKVSRSIVTSHLYQAGASKPSVPNCSRPSTLNLKVLWGSTSGKEVATC